MSLSQHLYRLLKVQPGKLNSNTKFKGKNTLQRENETRGQDLGGNRSRAGQEGSKMMPGNSQWPSFNSSILVIKPVMDMGTG